MSTKTELQAQIRGAILANPSADDKEIAKIVFAMNHPGEEYGKGCSPSAQYVARRRGHVMQESQAPAVEVKKPAEETPTTGEDGGRGELSPEAKSLLEEIEATTPPPPSIRPPKAPPEGSDFDGGKAVQMLSNGVAYFTEWDGWKLDPSDETDRDFLDASNRMIQKYGAEFLVKFGDEITFGIATAASIGPRIKRYKRHLDEQSRSMVEKAAAPPPPPPPPTPARSDMLDQNISAEPPKLPAGAKAAGEAEYLNRLERGLPA